MSVTLNTPVVTANVTKQGITTFMVEIPHSNGVMVKNSITATYEVTTFDENGVAVGAEAFRSVPFTEWPLAFKQAMASVYGMLETDAQNNGLMGTGTADPMDT